MLRVFKNEPGLGDKLAGRRNWCEIWEASTSIPARNQPLPEYQVAAQGSLVFTLRLEVIASLLLTALLVHDSPALSVLSLSALSVLRLSTKLLCRPALSLPFE